MVPSTFFLLLAVLFSYSRFFCFLFCYFSLFLSFFFLSCAWLRLGAAGQEFGKITCLYIRPAWVYVVVRRGVNIASAEKGSGNFFTASSIRWGFGGARVLDCA